MRRRMIRGAGLTALAVTIAWGSNEFIGFDPPTAVETPDAQWDLILADVNGDGDLDAITSSRSVAEAQILLGDGELGFGEATPFDVANITVAMTAADLNEDGAQDVILSHQPAGGIPGLDPDELTLILSDGLGGNTVSTLRFNGRGARAVGIADLDGDEHLDIVGSDDQTTWIALGDGEGNFDTPTGLVDEFGWVPFSPTGARIVDLDGDDDLDLAFATANGRLITHRNTGSLVFEPWRNLTAADGVGLAPAAAYGLEAHDLDDDGDIDLATYNDTAVAVYLNEGDGSFADRVDYSVDAVGAGTLASFVAGDFDGDGLVDFAVGGLAVGKLTVLRGLGDGTFAAPVKFDSAEDPRDRDLKRDPYPWAIDSGLVDGDALSDIVSVDLWNDILSVHRASDAAAPIVSALSPSRLIAGETRQLSFTGEGFQPDTTVDVGPGITIGTVNVISPTQLVVTATVPVALPAGTPTGNREVEVANPDGKCTTVTLELIAAPTPVLSAVAPGTAVAADTIDLDVRGELFDTTTTLDFGAGTVVNRVTLIDATQVIANVTFATGAATGMRPVTVTNASTGLSSVLDDALQIEAPPTIDLISVTGKIVDKQKTDRDSIKLKTPIVFNPFSADGTFDSQTDPVTLRIGAVDAPYELMIPAADPGWRVRRAKHTWKSPKGATPKVKLVIDTEKRKLVVKIMKLELPQTPVQLFFDLFAGDDRARSFRPVQLGNRGGVLRIL